MRRSFTMAFIAGAAVLLTATPAPARPRSEPPPAGVVAHFEGQLINLAEGWGEANACFSDDASTRCYRSETEMDEAEGNFPGDEVGVGARACAAALRLYRGTSYTGGVLSLSTQYTVLNLASYGFNNDTSSYRVGPCASRLYDTTTGGGLYPGSTGANVSSASMLAGWDNRIGSVYLL